MDFGERIQAISRFLLQSPPGEINDVLNDVRNIIADDELLQQGAQPALRDYNIAQFITADVPGCDHQSIVSEVALVKAITNEGQEGEEDDNGERFLDPRSKTIFKFNHLSLEATDPLPADPDPESEPFRAALEGSTLNYLSAHYHDGVSSVFSVPDSPNKFVIQIVANKYNPSNFWSGRWRSEYRIDLDSKTIQGKILVNVHYYEQGNVQLTTTHEMESILAPTINASSPAPSASKILALIEDEEGKYQTSLTDSYQEMSEKTYKGLRRALPMTRSKMDWDKVLGYKLGAELSTNNKGFGTS